MKGITVLVCGGRDYENRSRVYAVLEQLARERHISLVIQGGARGADTLALAWAAGHSIQRKTFHADWHAYGKAAGPMRNQQMLDEGKPNLVVAFPGGHGTADMVARARAAGIEIVEIDRTPTAAEMGL